MAPVMRQVRQRSRRRRAVVVLVALTGAANIFFALFPDLRLELFELINRSPHSGIVLAGRVAALELGAVLIFLAIELSRGSRQAWWLAVSLTGVISILELVRGHIGLTALLSVSTLVLLMASSRSYRLRTRMDRPGRWRIPAVMTAALFVFALVGYAKIDQLAPAPVGSRLAVIGRTLLFLPGGIDIEQGRVETYVFALRVGLFLILVALFWAAQRGLISRLGERDSIREFVRRYGVTSTAPLLALPDNQLLELDDGRAKAAVAIRSGTAVCLGAPVSEPDREMLALEELTTFCEEAGWTLALLALNEKQNSRALSAGFSSMKIGLEAIVDVPGFSTAGKRRSTVRHSVSRALRDNISVLPYEKAVRTTNRTDQLTEVSAQWVRNKGGPELGLTLGRFDPQRLDDQEVYVAVRDIGTPIEQVVAFVTWLAFNDGQSVVLDLMRRTQDSPPGVMELLIVESLAHFKEMGRATCSLGGVPLATEPGTPEDEEQGAGQRISDWLYAHGGQFYDPQGLFRFKDKFDPRWEPMYLAYPDRSDLPRIALAVARAFMPKHAVRKALAARRPKPSQFILSNTGSD